MKILITGGAGFIGSAVVRLAIARGHSVVNVDALTYAACLDNVADVAEHPRYAFEQADIRDRTSLDAIFTKHAADTVMHLAAESHVDRSIDGPANFIETNVNGTLNMLEAARQAGVKRFIYAASSSCYGIPDIIPTPETADIRTQYPYALTKYLGEQCLLHWGKVYKLPVLSLRLFNVYGPRSRTSGVYGAVFGVFLAQKMHDKPFTVVGDGTQTRDFTFVTDAVNALVTAAESDVRDEALNVGSDNTYSVNRLVELLGGDVVHIPKRPGEPDCTHADITKIRKLLGWQPKVPLEEGVQILLENIDYWRQAPIWTPETIAEVTREWHQYLSK